jgi:hypothetical protein
LSIPHLSLNLSFLADQNCDIDSSLERLVHGGVSDLHVPARSVPQSLHGRYGRLGLGQIFARQDASRNEPDLWIV